MKPKACKSCSTVFTPSARIQSVCSMTCCINLAEAKAAKVAAKAKAEDRKLTRIALVALKTRSTLIKEAQTAVNAWVRRRDAHLPCVSCGRMHEGQWHAGHYCSTGSRPDLRFDLANIHKQCAPCNNHLSGNLIPYRVKLINRIGQAEVDRLEGPATGVKLTRDELIALRAEYVAKLKGRWFEA